MATKRKGVDSSQLSLEFEAKRRTGSVKILPENVVSISRARGVREEARTSSAFSKLLNHAESLDW